MRGAVATMRILRRGLLVCVLLGSVLAPSAAGIQDRYASLVTALRTARARAGAPGTQAAVVACGSPVWAGSAGVTDVRTRRPVTTSTPFVLASTTKTVTATMVMQQVQAGKLSLSTPLARYYPRVPNASKITVRMLLNMTSGLPEAEDNQKIQEIQDTQPRHRWSRNELIAAIGKPRFRPGKRFDYVNTNYTLLGGILEQVIRRPIEGYFQQSVAKPAAMSSSTWTPSTTVINLMARPYERQGDGSLTGFWVNGFGPPSYYYGPVFTAGGLVSTATDLARFGNALLGARLVSSRTLAQMTNVGPDDYGLGVFAKRYDGHRWLGHNGSFQGYESENWTDPKRHVTLAVTTNGGNASDNAAGIAEQIWNSVAKAYDRSASTSCVRPARAARFRAAS